MMKYPKRETLTAWMLLPMLLGSAALPVGAVESAQDGAAATVRRESSHALRVQRAQVLAQVYAAAGMDEKAAFSYAWAALCAERDGKGNASELLAEMVRKDNLEEVLAALSQEDFAELLLALESVGAKPADKGAGVSAVLTALLHQFRNQNAAESLAKAAGMTSATFNGWAQAAEASRSEAQLMPSVWWLKNFSGSILQTEPMHPALQPPPSIASDGIQVEEEAPTQDDESAEDTLTQTTNGTDTEGKTTAPLSMAGQSSGGSALGGRAYAPLRTVAAAEVLPTIEVKDGDTRYVTESTNAGAVTLGSGSTLYVAADALTLSGTMTVQKAGSETEGSHLIVLDHGVVKLGTYQDYDPTVEKNASALNKQTAELFNALLNSTTTKDSGVVKIDSVSVQFGHNSDYNLADKKGLNAVFNARYEIEKDLQLQNYNQGSSHSKNPTSVPVSSWKISENGNVYVKGDLKLSSYQQLDVEGGKLTVDGTATLGHKDGNVYAAKLTIADGSYVQLKQIGDARTQQDGKSELVMTGGELVFTADGNVVTNKLGGITLSGGELVADGHSWVLNNNATIGGDEGLTIRTDAEHSVTLGVAGTTTTLAGQVDISKGSNAVLNGTYAGTGTVELADGASITLGQNFSTVAGSSVGLAGTGSVQVDWTGDIDALRNGFMSSYGITYRPTGIAGPLNLANASGLTWKDAEGNVLHNVTYQDGALKGTVNVDPTVYRFVTEDHRAVFDTEGNADGATAFRLYNNGKLFIGKDFSVSASQVTQNDYTLTLEGSGRYDLGTISKVQDIKLPGKLVLGNDWTGIIKLDGQNSDLQNAGQSDWKAWGMDGEGYRWDDMVRLDSNGKAQSWLELAGVKSFFNPDGTSPYNHTIAANLILAEGNALTINNGFGERTITFTGDIAGTGTFEHTPSANETYKFSGDISAWTGKFLKSAGGTAKVILSDNAHEVNAEFDKGTGTLNLQVETDAVFHANATVSALTVTDTHKITLAKGTEMHVTNALPSGTSMQQSLQNTYFSHVSGEGTLFLNFGSSTYDQMSITAGSTVTPDVNVVFTGDSDKHQNLAISMWGATSGGLKLDHTFLVADEMTLQWDAGLTVGQTAEGAGSLVLNKLHIGHSDNADNPARVTLSGGSMMLGQIDISSTRKNTFAMTGGVLEITNSGNAVNKSTTDTDNTVFTLAGGALRADGTQWVWNHDAVIGEKNGSALSVESLNGGAVTIGAAGVTTTLANTIDNHGTLTLDGTVNITMDASNKANGYVDQDGNFGMSVGFAATLLMPGAATYHVVTGNAATLGSDIVWKADGQTLNVVPADTPNASNDSYYFDGYNLRLVNEVSEAAPERVGTVYYVGGRGGDYHFDKAKNAAIVTGFDIANGTLHVDVSPEKNVSLALGYGALALGQNVAVTVDKQQGWSMDQGASVVLGEGSVLTLPGVEPETKADSYKVYQLLNNSTGSGTIVFDGTLDVQFGNAGHNFVSPDSYNILEDNGTADKGVNADIKTNVVVKGDMLIQNYRQGKDHPEVGSWWKVSEGGSLTVQGDLESSSYQKVSVDGGDLTVDGTYKIGHEAGREYEGDLELRSGSLTVGTLQTVHEDTSTVHISGGKLTVTKGNAFANTFREVSAKDAEFEGTWTWNHDATIGNITVTEGSAIALGTADTTLTLESPLKNHGALTLNGTIKADVQKQDGTWAYGTDETGYTPAGDGYYKRTDDLYTLISEGNDAALGANITFILNGETLTAADFHWNGKAIGMGGTEAGTVYYLNTTNGYTYTDADTRTTAFELVNTGATLRLERDPAGLEGIHALGGTVSLGSGVRMESALLNAENTVTMAGEGTYLLSNNALMAHPAEHHVSFADAAWTGTVQMSGMLGSEGTLNGLGNAGSWVEMQGVFGADAAPSVDVNVKLTDKGGETAWIYTGDGHAVSFTGDWAGKGTFAFATVVGIDSQQLTYSGDLSQWTGNFSAKGSTAQLHFAGNGDRTVNAAMLQQGGRIELTAETDTHFTKATQAAVYEADGGNLVAEQADGDAIDRIRATGGDISLKGLAENASITLEELVIGAGHRVSTEGAATPKETPLPELTAHITITGEQGQLTAGEAAGLYTGELNIESGATLGLADRTQGLQLSGALSLGDGGDIRLDDAMKAALKETGRLVLFTGVSELRFADGTTITSALSALDNIEAETYFSGLLERLNANGTGETYYLTYSGSADGGMVCIETPEPATTALSLLALFGMAFRRKRA